MPLPVVTRRTIDQVFAHFAEPGSWGRFLEEGKARLIEDNPELVHFIEQQVGKYPPPMHTPLFEIVVGALSLVKYQSDLDELADRPLPFNNLRKW